MRSQTLPMRFGTLLLLYLLSLGHIYAQQGIAYHTSPHASWYYLAPSGFGPMPGKAIFQNGMIAACQYQKTTPRGNTNTIGLIPTMLLGEKDLPVWVSSHRRFPIGGTPKRPSTIANLGGFFLSIPQNNDSGESTDLSMFYFNFTKGNRERNLAIGGAFFPTGFGKGIRPQAITLHGMTRLKRRSSLITENYIIHDRGAWTPVSISGWRFWKKDTAFDLALILTRLPGAYTGNQRPQWLPIPWLAFHRTLRYDWFG